jgi:hypothetical protein
MVRAFDRAGKRVLWPAYDALLEAQLDPKPVPVPHQQSLARLHQNSDPRSDDVDDERVVTLA